MDHKSKMGLQIKGDGPNLYVIKISHSIKAKRKELHQEFLKLVKPLEMRIYKTGLILESSLNFLMI